MVSPGVSQPEAWQLCFSVGPQGHTRRGRPGGTSVGNRGLQNGLGQPLWVLLQCLEPTLVGFSLSSSPGGRNWGMRRDGGNLRGDLRHVEIEPPWGVSEPPEGVSETLWGYLGHFGGGLSCLMGNLSPHVGCVSHLRGCLNLFGGAWATFEGD